MVKGDESKEKKGGKVQKKENKNKKDKPSKKSQNDELIDFKNKLKEKEGLLQLEKDKYLRLMAEFENYKKRTDKEKLQIGSFASEKVLLELLPSLDSFDRALSSFNKDHSSEDVFSGVQLIYKQIQDTLTKLGVEKLKCIGNLFDPEFHEAFLQQENDDVDENVVLDVIKNGYTYKNKVIRHAQVIISKKSNDKADDSK